MLTEASACDARDDAQGTTAGNKNKMFVAEHNSVMRRKKSASVGRKQMVLWQNGYMHRSEIPDIVVQFHGAPQK